MNMTVEERGALIDAIPQELAGARFSICHAVQCRRTETTGLH
ncbi:transcriptional regulator, partial [Pseudomonas sp. MWU12-2534b]